MNIFIRALIRENEAAALFIMYQFISTHAVLTSIREIIACNDFCLATSVFPDLWYPGHLRLRNSPTHFDLELIRFGFVHSSPGSHLKNTRSFGWIMWLVIQFLESMVWCWSICNNSLEISLSLYPSFILVLLAAHDFHLIYFCLLWDL